MCALYAAGFEAESSAVDSDPGMGTLRSRLLALRGPAAEALGCYRRLDGNGDHLIAAGDSTMFEEGNLQP